MIALSCLRLVNWHYFGETLVSFGERTLLAGDNGSGKSTIVDALQYVLAVDLRRFRFNAAAADRRSGRDLAGYLRCKLGADSTEYLRGDTVGHVMVEFSKGGESFAAGAAVDAFADGRLVERFWIADRARIAELGVSEQSGKPLSSKAFRDRMEGAGALVFEAKSEYLKELTNRLGVYRRLSNFNPYLEALTRSVSFTPLISVDKFVCDYILEDRPVDVSTMKANLESYKEAEREAALAVSRIGALEKAAAAAAEFRQYERLIVLQEYLKLRVDRDLAAESCAEASRRGAELAARLESLSSEIGLREAERLRLEAARGEAEASLARNDARLLHKRLVEQAVDLERRLAEAAARIERRSLLRGQASALLARPIGEDDEVEAKLAHEERWVAAAAAQEAARRGEEIKAALQDAVAEFAELEAGRVRFPESTLRLRDTLEAAGIHASVLADLAELREEGWRDAVEGWLNTQRFAVLVDPERFQQALELYNSLPKSVGGALLPNLARMREARVRQGSLAEVVATESPYARIYLDYVLGDVMRADLASLRTYDKSVTKDCMSYSRHSASRIREDIYRRPYLGRAARERRVAELRGLEEGLRRELAAFEGREAEERERAEAADRAYRALIEAEGLRGAGSETEGLRRELGELRARIEDFDISSFSTLEERLKALRSDLGRLEGTIRELAGAEGSAKERAAAIRLTLARAEADLADRERVFGDFARAREALAPDCEAYAAERLRTSSLAEISANYDSALKGSQTRLGRAKDEYSRIVLDYDARHNALLSADPAFAGEVESLLQRLRDSELPAYREKISKARRDAEREFKEHFVARLAEYIEEAKESFKELNETLRDMAFGRDRYRFTLEERQDRRGQLTVIRDAARIESVGDGLFAQLVDPEERKAAERLFERILRSDLESAELRSICDYRTYYSYDIKMQDQESLDPSSGKPVELSLSKVLREKSGGEAQTPYYVAIAASFYRFYRDRPEGRVRLVLFDEAFNRMDDERIGKALEFFKRLGMQLVVAVPTETIRCVAPWMDRVNLVVRHGRSAAVREFRLGEEP